jgi:uncharacterized protein (DUF1697 family)
MALVVFLRGVNVGGHRTFRPSLLASQLRHLDVVNIGAAGTFVVRKRVSKATVRSEFAKRLPFDTEIAICDGSDITSVIDRAPHGARAAGPGIVRFVSVLVKPSAAPIKPVKLPATGPWLVRVVSSDRQFVAGEYRRHMKTIGYLGKLDVLIGAPVTTRNWNTIKLIAKALSG